MTEPPDLRRGKPGSHRKNTSMGPKDRRRRRRSLIVRDGAECYWCRVPFSLEVPPTFDHIIARRKGGSDALANLVLACAPCNNSRSNPPLGRRRVKEDG